MEYQNRRCKADGSKRTFKPDGTSLHPSIRLCAPFSIIPSITSPDVRATIKNWTQGRVNFGSIEFFIFTPKTWCTIGIYRRRYLGGKVVGSKRTHSESNVVTPFSFTGTFPGLEQWDLQRSPPLGDRGAMIPTVSNAVFTPCNRGIFPPCDPSVPSPYAFLLHNSCIRDLGLSTPFTMEKAGAIQLTIRLRASRAARKLSSSSS